MLDEIHAKQVIQVFDQIPEIYFFIKDREGRFARANRALLDRLGLPDEQAILGTTDHDRYPAQIADRLVEDDRRVMETGEALLDQVEVLYDETGKLDWFSTTKMPLRDSAGKVIGVIGIVRSHEGHRSIAASHRAVSRVIEFVREDPGSALRVSDLARRAGVSERHLNRQFNEALGIGIQQFLIRSRVQNAAKEIRETNQSLAEIGGACGFYDQSAFTRQFRKHLGITPAAYRKRYRKQR